MIYIRISVYEFDHVIDQLRAQGVRMTPQRHEIVRLLIQLSHPTPEQVYQEFIKKYPSVGIATIYNNLKTLKELGYVQELSFGDNSSRYEWANEPHDHFTCTQCGQIHDVESPHLTDWIHQNISLAPGSQFTRHRLELYGLCADCNPLHHTTINQ